MSATLQLYFSLPLKEGFFQSLAHARDHSWKWFLLIFVLGFALVQALPLATSVAQAKIALAQKEQSNILLEARIQHLSEEKELASSRNPDIMERYVREEFSLIRATEKTDDFTTTQTPSARP